MNDINVVAMCGKMHAKYFECVDSKLGIAATKTIFYINVFLWNNILYRVDKFANNLKIGTEL